MADPENIEDLTQKLAGETPSVFAMIIIFLTITIIYLAVKSSYCKPSWNDLSIGGGAVSIGTAYCLGVLILQFFFNLSSIKILHHNVDIGLTVKSLIFWVLFIVIFVIINFIYKTWKIPFANTFGVFFANMLTSAYTDFKECLNYKDSTTIGASATVNQDGKVFKCEPEGATDLPCYKIYDAINSLESNPGIFLTQTDLDSFKNFWENLVKMELVNNKCKDNPPPSIVNWLFYKDLVSEGVWLLLTGILTIFISQEYIMNSYVAPNESTLTQNREIRQELADDIVEHNNTFATEGYALVA